MEVGKQSVFWLGKIMEKAIWETDVDKGIILKVIVGKLDLWEFSGPSWPKI